MVDLLVIIHQQMMIINIQLTIYKSFKMIYKTDSTNYSLHDII